MDTLSLSTDVLVIGSGIAGIAAALECRARGKAVTLLSSGVGATSVSSGAWDFGPAVQEDLSTALKKDWSDLYQKILMERDERVNSEDLLASSYALRDAFGDTLPLSFTTERPYLLPTSSGTLRSAFGAQSIQAAADIHAIAGKQVGFVCGPRWRVQSQSICDAWTASAKRHGIAVSIKPHVLLWPNRGKDWPVPRLAAELDAIPERWTEFVDTLKASLKEQRFDFLLFPPLLARASRARELAEALGVPVGETLCTLEPTAGMRLMRATHELLSKHDVAVVEGKVITHEEQQSQITRVRFQQPGSSPLHDIVAKHYILATGKLFGGGIHLGYDLVRETVFGLPVFTERAAQPVTRRSQLTWTDREFRQDQPWEHLGLWVDKNFRPMDSTRSFVFENVSAAGSIIGGIDFARNRVGLGWMAYTGRECARLVS